MVKKFLFIFVLLSFYALPLFSQDFVLVPVGSLNNWQSSKQKSIESMQNLINCKIQLESDLEKWIGKSEDQAKLIIEKDNIILNLSVGLENEKKRTEEKSKLYEQSNEIWKEKEVKLKASFQAEQIKVFFIVGGVCLTVGVGIGIGVTMAIVEALKQ